MCLNFVSTAQDITSASRENVYRRLTLCLLGGLVFAFALLPDYLIARTDNATSQQASADAISPEPVRTQKDKFKWKFIVCFPLPVDVLPARSAGKHRLGGAGLVSALGGVTVNDLLGPH